MSGFMGLALVTLRKEVGQEQAHGQLVVTMLRLKWYSYMASLDQEKQFNYAQALPFPTISTELF